MQKVAFPPMIIPRLREKVCHRHKRAQKILRLEGPLGF